MILDEVLAGTEKVGITGHIRPVNRVWRKYVKTY